MEMNSVRLELLVSLASLATDFHSATQLTEDGTDTSAHRSARSVKINVVYVISV